MTELNDAKAIVAALELIFSSSARYGVSTTDLSSELQQLGLPREHSTVMARLHTDHCPKITATLSGQSLRGMAEFEGLLIEWNYFFLQLRISHPQKNYFVLTIF